MLYATVSIMLQVHEKQKNMNRGLKIVSMIRKYHTHKPQQTPWHHEEEPLNHHETPGRQTKQSNQLSLHHQDDCNTRMETTQRTIKHRTTTDPHNGSNNKQKVWLYSHSRYIDKVFFKTHNSGSGLRLHDNPHLKLSSVG